MNALNFRDLAFLASAAGGGPAAPISDTDVNTWGWWSTDKFLVPVVNSSDVDVWGNRMASQVDKTDKTGSTNFYSYASAIRPSCGRADTLGNLFMVSHDIITTAIWTGTLFTKNSATTGTFTAQNGRITQVVYGTRPGITYRLRAKIRRVTGNTALHWYHSGSPSGTSTAVTVDGVLTEYTTTFLGHATAGQVIVGLQDQNAAGHGQIEVTEWHLTESGWSTTYLENQSVCGALFPAIGGKRCVFTGKSIGILMCNGVAPVPSFSDPCTFYILWQPRYKRANGLLFSSINPAWDIYCDLNTTDESVYTNTAPFTRLDTGNVPAIDTWRVTTGVWNGGSSAVRRNKAAAVTGVLGSVGAINAGLYLGGDAFGGGHQDMAIYEFIVRTVADNTATQDTFINYLAARVGLIV